MKILSLHTLRLLLSALILLAATASCYNYDQEEFNNNTADNHFINVTISVSASDSYVTRANPNGGEYGDGVEKGIEDRENQVNNITLIFYELSEGASLNNPGEAAVSCVLKYDVYPLDKNHPHEHTGAPDGYNANEVLYTTGDKLLERTTLEVGKTYHVLVVANADLLVAPGDLITAVRDKLQSQIYNNTGVGVNATDFVMASSADETVTLTNPEVNADENKFVFNFQCLHIERLAARIDYWAKNATYETVTQVKDEEEVTTTGYQYDVKDAVLPDGTKQKFILTRITPFNLNDGNEYLFKRTNDDNPYLADETTTNWVVDPYTNSKTGAAVPSFIKSPLNGVVTTFENDYTVSMAAQQANKLTVGDSDDIIIGYPKENTLTENSPLYYYATGLAFEGYFINGTERVKKVFYYFIRHQGENTTATATAYETYMKFDDTAKTATIASIAEAASTGETTVDPTAMNYGIVRNNIYRISIETVTPGWLKLKIAVHDWREVTHPEIYI